MALINVNGGAGADTARIERSASVINANAAYTIMGWMRQMADPNNYSHIIHLGGTFSYDGVTDSLGTNNDGTTRRVSCDGGSVNQQPTSGSFTLGAWTHWAMVRVSTTSLLFYIDGAEVTGLACTSNVGSRTATSLMVALNYNQFALAGKLCDVKAWTSALTAAQVALEMRYKAPLAASPWGYWPMDDFNELANNYLDRSGNSRDWSAAGAGSLTVDSDYPPFPETGLRGRVRRRYLT